MACEVDDAPGRTSVSRLLLMLLLLLIACLAGIEALRMTDLKIPQHVALNQTVRMECNFNLDQENLYSVKWYKDGHEFYRYVPKEEPRVHVFPLLGVTVDERSSTEKLMVLRRVSGDSSGRYRCEVSGEAPAFNTVSDHADMTVVALPERGPTISGVKSKYQAGDIIRVNCTSAPSKPPATLKWYVNDEEAETKFLKGPRIIKVDPNDLETSQLGLEFRAGSKHFLRGDMKLKCLATISTVYKRSNERRVTGDEKFLKQPMESRGTRAQSMTRNDNSTGLTTRLSMPIMIVSSLLIVTGYYPMR